MATGTVVAVYCFVALNDRGNLDVVNFACYGYSDGFTRLHLWIAHRCIVLLVLFFFSSWSLFIRWEIDVFRRCTWAFWDIYAGRAMNFFYLRCRWLDDVGFLY